MRRAGSRMTLDMFDEFVPAVGSVFRRVRKADGECVGYGRVTGVRQIRVRVSRGETARFCIHYERLGVFPEGGRVVFTVNEYPRRKKPARDRFDPLL